MKPTYIVGGIIVVIILAIAAFLFTQNQQAPSEVAQIEEQSQEIIGLEATEDADTGTVETIDLTPVGDYTGSGEATRMFDGTTFTHAVSANIADPAEGKFYEGWLVDKQPTLRFFSTGKLEKQNGEYTLLYTDSQDYPEYNDVVITEETESLGLDGNPEDHVLEGSF